MKAGGSFVMTNNDPRSFLAKKQPLDPQFASSSSVYSDVASPRDSTTSITTSPNPDLVQLNKSCPDHYNPISHHKLGPPASAISSTHVNGSSHSSIASSPPSSFPTCSPYPASGSSSSSSFLHSRPSLKSANPSSMRYPSSDMSFIPSIHTDPVDEDVDNDDAIIKNSMHDAYSLTGHREVSPPSKRLSRTTDQIDPDSNDLLLSRPPKSLDPGLQPPPTNTSTSIPTVRLRANPAPKRDRPLSSYFDSPVKELDDFFKYADVNGPTHSPHEVSDSVENDDYFSSDSPTQTAKAVKYAIRAEKNQQQHLTKKMSFPNDDHHKHTNGTDSETHPDTTSPLPNRKPFKNLSNFVNQFEFPMKKKFSSTTNKFTKSMSSMAKLSHNEFDKIFSNPNSNNSPSAKDRHHSNQRAIRPQLKHKSSEDTDIDDDDDANNTTLNDDNNDAIGNDNDIMDINNDDGHLGIGSDILGSPTQASPSNIKSKHRSSSPSDKAIRRIHSMYQTTKEKQIYNDMMMEDNAHLPKSSIPTFKSNNDLLPRIDEHQLLKIINGEYSHEFDEFIIIDCRFNYEFDGGHINGALNISSQKDLEHKFITGKLNKSESNINSRKQLLIFHCEFSIFRGPTMASHLRKCDRILNSDNYPLLSYPDIVVLEGGYKSFYDKYKTNCQPQGYIEMKNVNHQKTCEAEMDKIRQQSKLTRAKSHNNFPSSFNSIGNNNNSQIQNGNSSVGRPLGHNRSSSYTTVTSHSENLKILKRQRSSSKVQNRNSGFSSDGKYSRSSTVSYASSIFNSTTSPVNGKVSSASSLFEDDFQPPPALFRSTSSCISNQNNNHRPSLTNSVTNRSSSSFSINSSSSFGSDQYSSAFSSNDSLADSYTSPLVEFPEYLESSKSGSGKPSMPSLTGLRRNSGNSFGSLGGSGATKSSSTSLLNPMLRKPSGPVPQAPHLKSSSSSNVSTSAITSPFNDGSAPKKISINHNSTNVPHAAFKFPNNSSNTISSSKSSRNGLNRINTKPSLTSLTTSPIISSPLSTVTPQSTIDTAMSGNTLSLIDPINDTPVDFSVPFTNSSSSSHAASASGPHGTSSSYYGANYGIAKTYGRQFNHASKRSQGGGLYNFVSLDIDEVEEENE